MWTSEKFGGLVERIYARGGWILFLKPVLAVLRRPRVAGLAAYCYLVAERYGTPFVVVGHVGIGAVVFVAGRFALVALHELVARPGLRVLRAARRTRGLQGGADLPVRVRRHLGGLVRAARAAHRDQLGRAAERLRRGRRVRARLAPERSGRHARHRVPGRPRRLPRRALQPQPDARPRRLPHPDRRRAPAEPARARPGCGSRRGSRGAMPRAPAPW